MKPLPNIDPSKLVWPELENPTLLQRAMDAVWLIVMLLALLAVWGWAMTADYHDKLEDQKKATNKYSKMVATVLNGGTLHDRETGTAFFFDKPTVLRILK